MRRSVLFSSVVAAAVAVGATALTATQQQPPAGAAAPAASAQDKPQPPAGRGRAGGGGRGPQVIAFEDRTGFTPIFDGTSLKGWEGDPGFWRVENGAIVGESTEANPVKQNTFVIYRGAEPGDFDLKVELRLTGGNTGVQYRSAQVPPDEKTGKWVLKGYQADFDANNTYTGMLYEERGRGIIMQRGGVAWLGDGARGVIGTAGSPDDLKPIIKDKDWNQFHVIARGNTLIHILNGRVTAVLVDDDVKNRAAKGLIGFQIHTGPPMKVEFRNVLLKQVQ